LSDDFLGLGRSLIAGDVAGQVGLVTLQENGQAGDGFGLENRQCVSRASKYIFNSHEVTGILFFDLVVHLYVFPFV
jgi:hypothetical protein